MWTAPQRLPSWRRNRSWKHGRPARSSGQGTAKEDGTMEIRREPMVVVSQPEAWIPWPVSWSAIWVGALSAIALALVFGLVGIALGLHLLGPSGRIVDWHKFGI